MTWFKQVYGFQVEICFVTISEIYSFKFVLNSVFNEHFFEDNTVSACNEAVLKCKFMPFGYQNLILNVK